MPTYRAVLAAVNAPGENQRELTQRVGTVETRLVGVEDRLSTVETKLDETGTRVRSIEEQVAEVKELLVRALDR